MATVKNHSFFTPHPHKASNKQNLYTHNMAPTEGDQTDPRERESLNYKKIQVGDI
jgi:hypothetical protein